MRNRLSALRLQNKIFIAYGLVFLVMFGVILGSTYFLIRLAFKREIYSYIETLQAQISNKYRVFVESVQKDVHAAATDVKLHRAIEKQPPSPYLPIPEFDFLEYGTPEGKLLYPDLRGAGSSRLYNTYNSLENKEGHIHLRNIPQQSDIGPQFVVQATEVGEWGFITGGHRLQEWLEAQTTIQSDDHPIFLVVKPQTSNAVPSVSGEDWLPLNNASRATRRSEWLESFSSPQSDREVLLHGTEENGGSTYTAFRITPFNSPFAIASEVAAVDLIVAYSHRRQMEWQQRLMLTLLLSGISGLALVYLISYLISRRITQPIETLHEGVGHIAAGDLDHRVKVRSRNEIGQLADGFNQMARELKRSLEEQMAAERAATWRDVARQVAHEIKNPLFPIRLSVENLQQAKSDPEIFEQIFRECTDTVIEEVDRIGKLIDEFHQFARMPKLQRKPTQLNNIIRSVLNLYLGKQDSDLPPSVHRDEPDREAESAPANLKYKDAALQDSDEKFWLEKVSKIKLETDLGALPQLWLDPEQTARALGNLLKNAIEAMPDGGLLKVKTCFIPNGNQWLAISSRSECAVVGEKGNSYQTLEAKSKNPKASKGIVSLEIRDTGRGMSEETMANLFVPYYTTKSGANGTGLGMPIVKRIITEHGAEMDCQSTENVGTTVRIRLPYNSSIDAEELAAE